MRINKVTITNLLGLESLEFKPGSGLTVITGKNATGKTSVLEAFRAALGGGHDASLIRAGSEAAEVVLILDDGTTIKKRETQDRTSIQVKDPRGTPVPQPQSWLKRLADVLALNPVVFLTAPKADRLRYLLETIPMEIGVEELSAAIGHTYKPGPAAHMEGVDRRNGFDLIAQLQKEFANERTGVSRAAKEKASTVKTLEAALPPKMEGGESVEEVTAAHKKAENELDLKLASIEATAREKREDINHQLDGRLAELRRQAQDAKDEAAAEAEGLAKQADAAKTQAQADAAPALNELVGRLGEAREVAKQNERVIATRETIEQLKSEIAQLEEQASEHEAAIGGLAELKDKLLKRIPIPGLEVREGDLFLDGLPFDRVNQSKRVKTALKLVQLRAGELPLVCVDGLEALDEETINAFKTIAPKTGLQLVVSRVSDGPLNISTKESEAVA